MDNRSRALMMGAGSAEPGPDVTEVFSTWLYTGNGSTQTITNEIDLSGKGGLVWMKRRDNFANHFLHDTARGASRSLQTSTTDESLNTGYLSSFSSTGFTIGGGFGDINASGSTYTSWTFRKQSKFFDVVTYTGNGNNRTIAHNLGSVPGCIIVKRTDSAADWQVYHRSLANTDYMVLNSTAASSTGTTRWNSTTPTSTEFSLGTDATVNASGGTYIAYLFAHDAGGFGNSGNDSIIKCGSYTGTGSGSPQDINLGWEAQWVMVRGATWTENWYMYDNMRGLPVSGTSALLWANLGNAEAGGSGIYATSTGFNTGSFANGNGQTYIYIAIRRGPMKTPTDATKVYTTATQGSAGDSLAPGYRSTFPVDFAFWTVTDSAGSNRRVMSRMQGINGMYSDLTNAEASFGSSYKWDYQNGFWDNTGTGTTTRAWMFRRAPGFFDVVCYTGTSSNLAVTHNLAVAPELIIWKSRTSSTNWIVGFDFTSTTSKVINLDTTGSSTTRTYPTGEVSTQPTATTVTMGNSNTRQSGDNYVMYLFASLTGISKVGSYTGTGTTLSVDCGFTNGARFVLIKRTDSTGDWYVWDTARGIVANNDPYLLLNSTAAEVTNTDYIDPLSSGFQITSTAPAAINANGGSFIFLAIA